MPTFELKLADGRVVTWEGIDAVDAASRYVASHPEATVRAWRRTNRHGLFGGLDRLPRIVEPGDPGWRRG